MNGRRFESRTGTGRIVTPKSQQTFQFRVRASLISPPRLIQRCPDDGRDRWEGVCGERAAQKGPGNWYVDFSPRTDSSRRARSRSVADARIPTAGDVVALALANTGEFLATTKVRTGDQEAAKGSIAASSSPTSSPATQYTLVPTNKSGVEDEVVFLEVVRDGPWVGLKSWVANGALLQAKRKGTHRLAFFSPRFGVYEQWGLDEGEGDSLDGIHWASTVVTLRNRKVPSVVLKVEIHRVGVCHRPKGDVEGAVEKSRVTPAFDANPGIVAEPADGAATQSIRTMSTLMVQEWIKFVEKEKARRARLQAKVDRATEDVEGLRRWAAQQIQCARHDVQEEIEMLLDTLNHRNAALADVQARLDTRIQWGAALLEAKKAMILGRRVLLAWKARAARSKYCEAVVNKLRKRNQVRAALRAIDSWRDEVDKRKDMQKRLRLGVRRMSYLKMQGAFSGWRRTSFEAHELARYEAARNQEASLIADSQRAKSVLAAWKKRAARSKEARRLLGFAANRYRERMAASTFAAWKYRAKHIQMSSADLARRVLMREKTRLTSTVLDGWRLAVDDGHGEKIEHDRSVAFYVKKTLKKSIDAWRKRVADVQEIEVEAELARMHRERAVAGGMLIMWRQHALTEIARRDSLVNFVHDRALRRMGAALWFWKEHASFKRSTEASVQQAARSRVAVTLHRCISKWRAHVLEKKIHRRFIKIFTERRGLRQAKETLSAWRATNKRSNKTFSGLLEYTEVWSQKRMRKAFNDWREYASEKARERALETKAARWHVTRLSGRVLCALETEVGRRAQLVQCLESIGDQRNLGLKRRIWNVWQFEVDETAGREANLRNFQLRKAWHVVNQAFLAWNKTTAEEKFQNNTAVARQAHVDSMRLGWAFATWRDTTLAQVDERLTNRKADNWHRYKVLSRATKAWKAQKGAAHAIALACQEQYARRQLQSKHKVFLVWRKTSDYHGHLRSILLTITNSRALEMQQSAFNAWRDKCESSRAKAVLVQRAANKLSELRARQVFEHWRIVSDDSKGKTMYLERMEALVDKKNTRSTLQTALLSWRSRCLDIRAGIQLFDERNLIKLSVVKANVFSSWKYQTDRAVPLREKALAAIVQRQSSRLMIQAFASWRHETKTQSRNGIIVIHAIDRLSFRTMKEALFAWRIAAVERKRRRDMMVCLMEQSFKRRMRTAFSAWRHRVAEDIRVRQNLERCITQKRVAYELYRESYWETVDEELQETLRAMFREAETEEEDFEFSESEEHFAEETEGAFHASPGELDLDAIALAFEKKRRELSIKVAAAVSQGQDSPGHALTPPKRELNLLEPLSALFSSRVNQETIASGAETIDSISISSLDSAEAAALLDVETEDFDWSSCDDDDERDESVESVESVGLGEGLFPDRLCRKLGSVVKEAPTSAQSSSFHKQRGMLFELGLLEEPQSPRILARAP